MSNKYSMRNRALLLLLIAVVSGCEVLLPQHKEVQDEVVLEKYQGVPLQKALTDLQNLFNQAKDELLYFFSPNNYRLARSGLQAARAYYRNPERKMYVLKSIYKAQQALEDGFKVKAIVVRELPEFIQLQNALVRLEAKNTHSREFYAQMNQMNNLIERVEEEKEALFSNADKKAKFEKDKKAIIADLMDFRLRVIKYRYLNHAENLIAEADSVDARAIAPQTYKATIAERDKAVAYIENNADNLEGVQQASEQFEFAAQRLMHISRAVFNVLNLQPNTHEEYVLRQEQRLGKIASALKAGDLRDQSFGAQATQLASIVKRTVKQKEDLALQVAELRSATGIVAAPDAEVQAAGGAPDNGQQGPGANELAARQAVQGQDMVIPVAGGDPEEMKKSVRLLTDQVYQLIIENDRLKGQNRQLQKDVKKIQAQLANQAAPAKPISAKEAPSGKTSPSSEKAAQGKQAAKPAVKKPAATTPKAAESTPAKTDNTAAPQ